MTEMDNTMMKKRYDNIDLLKCLSTLMVISLHIPLWSDNFIESSSIPQIIQYAFRLISEGVPFFVAVNGFLMLQKKSFDMKLHLRKMGRIFGLFVLWAGILICVSFALWGVPEELSPEQFIGYILDTKVGSPYTGVLWFLENLLGVYVVFPILWKIYQDDFSLFRYFFLIATVFVPGIGCLELIADAVSTVSQTTLIYSAIGFIKRFNSIGNGWYIYYFCLGGMIFHYLDVIKEKRFFLSSAGFLSWLFAFTYGYLMSVKTNTLYKDSFNYGSVFMVIFIIGVFALTIYFQGNKNILTRIICDIGKNSFGIYVSHTIFIQIIRKFFSIDGIVSRITAFVIVLILSYGFSVCMGKNKSSRKLISVS